MEKEQTMTNDKVETSATPTAQETLKTIYHDVVTGSAEVSGRLKTLLDDNRDQYLVIRDGEGRILIKVSLLGGLLLAAMSVLITRLRWMPLLAIVLSLVRLQMTIETENEASAQTVIASAKSTKGAKTSP